MIPPTMFFLTAVAIWGSSGKENLWIQNAESLEKFFTLYVSFSEADSI